MYQIQDYQYVFASNTDTGKKHSQWLHLAPDIVCNFLMYRNNLHAASQSMHVFSMKYFNSQNISFIKENNNEKNSISVYIYDI